MDEFPHITLELEALRSDLNYKFVPQGCKEAGYDYVPNCEDFDLLKLRRTYHFNKGTEDHVVLTIPTPVLVLAEKGINFIRDCCIPALDNGSSLEERENAENEGQSDSGFNECEVIVERLPSITSKSVENILDSLITRTSNLSIQSESNNFVLGSTYPAVISTNDAPENSEHTAGELGQVNPKSTAEDTNNKINNVAGGKEASSTKFNVNISCVGSPILPHNMHDDQEDSTNLEHEKIGTVSRNLETHRQDSNETDSLELEMSKIHGESNLDEEHSYYLRPTCNNKHKNQKLSSKEIQQVAQEPVKTSNSRQSNKTEETIHVEQTNGLREPRDAYSAEELMAELQEDTQNKSGEPFPISKKPALQSPVVGKFVRIIIKRQKSILKKRPSKVEERVQLQQPSPSDCSQNSSLAACKAETAPEVRPSLPTQEGCAVDEALNAQEPMISKQFTTEVRSGQEDRGMEELVVAINNDHSYATQYRNQPKFQKPVVQNDKAKPVEMFMGPLQALEGPLQKNLNGEEPTGLIDQPTETQERNMAQTSPIEELALVFTKQQQKNPEENVCGELKLDLQPFNEEKPASWENCNSKHVKENELSKVEEKETEDICNIDAENKYYEEYAKIMASSSHKNCNVKEPVAVEVNREPYKSATIEEPSTTVPVPPSPNKISNIQQFIVVPARPNTKSDVQQPMFLRMTKPPLTQHYFAPVRKIFQRNVTETVPEEPKDFGDDFLDGTTNESGKQDDQLGGNLENSVLASEDDKSINVQTGGLVHISATSKKPSKFQTVETTEHVQSVTGRPHAVQNVFDETDAEVGPIEEDSAVEDPLQEDLNKIREGSNVQTSPNSPYSTDDDEPLVKRQRRMKTLNRRRKRSQNGQLGHLKSAMPASEKVTPIKSKPTDFGVDAATTENLVQAISESHVVQDVFGHKMDAEVGRILQDSDFADPLEEELIRIHGGISSWRGSTGASDDEHAEKKRRFLKTPTSYVEFEPELDLINSDHAAQSRSRNSTDSPVSVLSGDSGSFAVDITQHLRPYYETTVDSGNKFMYSCKQCDFKSERESHTKIHIRIHIEPFWCSLCFEMFDDTSVLETHLEEQHVEFFRNFKPGIGRRSSTGAMQEKPYKCGYCNYSSSYTKRLNNHLLTHKKQKLYICYECNFTTTKDWTHLNHLKEHKQCVPKVCDDCGFSDSNREVMNEHMKLHNRRTIFKCDLCTFTSGSFGYLTIHRTFHLEKKESQPEEEHNVEKEQPSGRYKCGECRFSSEIQEELFVHGRRQHRQMVSIRTYEMPAKKKSYLCLLCNFTLHTLPNVKMHVQGHTGEKPFKCIVCGFQTQTEVNFEAHCRFHYREKHYQCTKCNQMYKTLHGLDKHRKRVHGY